MPNTKSKYQLSTEENKQYFQKEILPEYKLGKDFTAKEQPIAHFTAGIPGAGKSNIVEEWKRENPNIVVIDADKLRKRHPNRDKIQQEHGPDAAKITHPDAISWVEQLNDEAIKSKTDYILDGSMRDPVWAKYDIDKAINTGYNVEVTMVGVNKYESLQGVNDRYAKEYAVNPKQARFVDPAFVKEANISIKESAAVIDSLDIKQFKIVDRSGEVVFDSTKDTKGTAKEKLENHTDLKNWTPEKLDTLKQNFAKSVDRLTEVKAPQEVINSAKSDQSSLNTQIKDIKQTSMNEKDLYEKVKAFKESRPENNLGKEKFKGLEMKR